MARFLTLLFVLSLSLPAPAATDSAPKKAPQGRFIAGLKDVSVQPARRMRAKGFDWDHEIQIALPASYGKTDKPYPVLWVTDGSAYFEMAVKAVNSDLRAHIPEMIVVAVGSPPDGLEQYGVRRGYDFTETKDWGFKGLGGDLFEKERAAGKEKLKAAGQKDIGGGGAQTFLNFLVDDVRAALSRDYRVGDEHTLFGDSGGGYFCTYALFERPGAFSKYICGSPNLYGGDYALFHTEDRYAKEHKDLKAAVFFGAGEAEILEKNIIPAWGIVSSMARMAEILSLRKYPSLELHARIFPGEDHMSVIPLNLSWGLRTLWKDKSNEKK